VGVQRGITNISSDYLAARILTGDKLYAFWKLEDKKLRFIGRYFNLADHEIVTSLRLYDITSPHLTRMKDSFIHEAIIRHGCSSWLFKGVSKNRNYVLELGILINENKFFPLLRSNKIISADQRMHEMEGQNLKQAPEWDGKVSTYTYYENIEGSS
jgi:hypothetical protein